DLLVLGFELLRDRAGVVGRPVLDDHYLERRAAIPHAGEEQLDGRGQEGLLVERGQNDRDQEAPSSQATTLPLPMAAFDSAVLRRIFKAYDVRGLVPEELNADVASATRAAFV